VRLERARNYNWFHAVRTNLQVFHMPTTSFKSYVWSLDLRSRKHNFLTPPCSSLIFSKINKDQMNRFVRCVACTSQVKVQPRYSSIDLCPHLSQTLRVGPVHHPIALQLNRPAYHFNHNSDAKLTDPPFQATQILALRLVPVVTFWEVKLSGY
jgi:hypothetical protein